MSATDTLFFPASQLRTDYISWIWQRVGPRKLFLLFAPAVLWDKCGRILLRRRTDFERWGVPVGALELAESIVTCARLEVRWVV